MDLKRKLRAVVYWIGVQFPINLIRVLTDWLPDSRPVLKLRGWLLRPFFKTCGRNLQVASGVQWLNVHRIELGRDVFIGFHCWLNGLGGLRIDDEVMLGPFVVVSTLRHRFAGDSVRFGGHTAHPVHIGAGSWLAARVCVTEGVCVGSGVVAAAGAVITQDVPDHVVCGGVPAKVLASRTDDEKGAIHSRWDVIDE